MLPTKQFHIYSVALGLVLALAAVGCGKDKSLDDYQESQANESYAKLLAVAYPYGGASSMQTAGAASSRELAQKMVIPTQITLQAVMNPVPSGDNSGTSSRASLQGNVTLYVNGVETSGVITTASFVKAPDQDSDSVGTISGQISVPIVSSSGISQSAAFSLNGTINDTQFNGVITPSDRPGSTAAFSLVRNAAVPKGQNSVAPSPSQTRAYTGSTPDPQCSNVPAGATPPARCKLDRTGNVIPDGTLIPVVMTVNPAAPSEGFVFVNLFAEEKLVNVHLQLAQVPIPLPAIDMNQTNGALTFGGSVTNSAGTSQVTFACNLTGSGAYSCAYENVNQAQTYNFTVNPAASVPQPPSNPSLPPPAPSPVPTQPDHHHR